MAAYKPVKVIKVVPCRKVRATFPPPPPRKPPAHKKKKVSVLARFNKLKNQLLFITRDLRKRLWRLSARVSVLTGSVNDLNTQVSTLQATVSGLSAALPETGGQTTTILLSRLSTPVAFETDAGSIVGTLVAVGTNYVEILEPTGASVLLPTNRINSFS